ncbi:hypothetical protein EDC18_102300 [Natranaerovirga pectinivora]|uniref:UPF0178 protein EDC18_102300 n=1 Tax=Natranaerovirga pectinivora TaxID=682400 RepID=A0A4R3MMS8_9FIRM|nr:YaiI/YqxD family protein [Natranaerovirga pectinivora]TCT16283.1 hypothetical protein EDC18_102300 [Natranaerovirga pectinivora]
MKILVDADACPVKDIIINIAKKYNLEVIMFFDTSHIYKNDYCKVVTVDKGRDSADFALIGSIKSGDLVISQDYGVASISLSKKAIVLNQDGFIYTDDNIDLLLFQRHLSKTNRRHGNRPKGPKKRTSAQDDSFRISLIKVIEANL